MMDKRCKDCGWYNPDNKDGKFKCPCKEQTVWANTKSCEYIEQVNEYPEGMEA